MKLRWYYTYNYYNCGDSLLYPSTRDISSANTSACGTVALIADSFAILAKTKRNAGNFERDERTGE